MEYENYSTIIHQLNYTDSKNSFYIKRDDLLPFSFGGNKVRIAQEYFKDMDLKKNNCIIAYGNSRSNLCRVIANMSMAKGIPCYVISTVDSTGNYLQTNNSVIVNQLGANIIFCDKKDVSQTVEKVINECKFNGYSPYYIYGDINGKGNEEVSVQAYVNTYKEIEEFELMKSIDFDYIFHASGTGTTQSGLICGSLLSSDNRKIIGISIARNYETNKDIIKNNISIYMKKTLDELISIQFEDKYVLNGYGEYNNEILETIKRVLNYDGIPLDTTYTGKAFWGMTEFLKEHKIEGKKILFIHTGGTPLFYDNLNLLQIGGGEY